MQALRLDNNRLEELNGLLNTQHHLQWLNVSHNLLQWFDYAFIPKSLLWLNLRNNRIEELGNYYDMQAGFRLVHLDVGGNRLQRVDRECLVHSLKEVSWITVGIVLQQARQRSRAVKVFEGRSGVAARWPLCEDKQRARAVDTIG